MKLKWRQHGSQLLAAGRSLQPNMTQLTQKKVSYNLHHVIKRSLNYAAGCTVWWSVYSQASDRVE